MAIAVSPPFDVYTGLDGLPVDAGSIYVGVANQNPEISPVSVYWDAANTIPAAQPIPTLAGYPSRNGTPAQIYVTGDYSITVRDKRGRFLYNAPTAVAGTLTLPPGTSNEQPASTAFVTTAVSNAANTLATTSAAGMSVKSYGAAGDGVADDTTPFLNAIAAAITGSKHVYVPPGTYKLSQRLDLSAAGLAGGLWLDLADGAVLDYSHAGAPWENNGSSGLIYAKGTKGSAVSITKSIPEVRRSLPVNHAGVTISAGVATVPCTVAHGLTTGALVHVASQPFPAVTGTAGFFSQPYQAGAAGDIPHEITVIDSLTFSFPTTATVVPASASYFMAANVLYVASGQGVNFAQYDIVEIDTGAELIAGGGHHDGELNRVKWVSGDKLVMQYEVQCPIDTANSPTVRKITPVQNIRITGGELRGRGREPSAALVYGQSGVRVELGENVRVERMNIHRVDQTGLEYCSVINGSVRACRFTTDPDDEGGRLTGFIKIQYGIAIGCATRNMLIQNCHFYGLRHAVEGGGTSANPGRAYNIVLDSCSFGGNWVSDVATHSTNGSMWVTRCSFAGRGTAINTRSGRLYVINNEMSGNQRALDMLERPEHIEFSDNRIRNIGTDVIFASSSTMVRWPSFYIRGNKVDGCSRFYRQDAMTIAASDVFIEGNHVKNCELEAVRITGGGTTPLRSRAHIIGNTVEGVVLGTTSGYGIRVIQGVDCVISDNLVRTTTGTMISGVRVEGSNTTGTKAADNHVYGATGAPVDIATGDFTIDGEAYIQDVHDAGNLAAGASEIRQVTATGATVGDQVTAISHGIATDNLQLTLAQIGTDFIRYRITNVSGGAYDPPSTTYRIAWRRKYK